MNRRGISTAALAIGAVVVLVVVAVVAFAAGAASSDRGDVGWMDGIMGRRFGGIGGFGGVGMVLGWLLMLLLIAGIVWALVMLLRPAEPRPPQQWTPPPGTSAGTPVTPSPGVEAFEAWHRQAHAADPTGAAGHEPPSATPPEDAGEG